MDKRIANALYVILIIAVICFMIWFVSWLKTESRNCVQNPIRYFKVKNPDISCYCYQDGKMVEGLSEEIVD